MLSTSVGAALRVPRWTGPCLALALACLPIGSARAAQDVCQVSGSCDWGPIGSHAGCSVSCGTIDGDDIVQILDGARMRCVDDLTWNDTPGAELSVESGGEFECNASHDARVITLGPAAVGLRCRDGATCTFKPGYRSWGLDDVRTLISREQLNAIWTIDEIRFCPNLGGLPDCDGDSNGNPSRIRLLWKPTPVTSASIAELEPNEDLFCPWDFNENDGAVPYDAGFCHPIVQRGIAQGRPGFDIDIDGGSFDPGGYPLALRRNLQSRLAVDAVAGDRSVVINCHGSVQSCHLDLYGPRSYIGYWLYISDGIGRVVEGPYKIIDTDFNHPDDPLETGRITIMRAGDNNRRGLDRTYPAGTQVFISYVGLRPNDTFYVQVPVKITSATPPNVDATDSAVTLLGTTTAQGLWLEDVSELTISGGPVVGPIRDIVKRGGGDGAPFTGEAFSLGASGVTVDHFVNSGDEPFFTDHGLRLTGTAANNTLRHLYFQFNGDDDVVYNTTIGGGHSIEFVHVRHEAAGDDSSEMFDFRSAGGPITGVTTVANVVCEGQCGHKPWSNLVDTGPDNPVDLENMVVVGHAGTYDYPASGAFRNLFIVNPRLNGAGSGLLPDNVDGCVARDVAPEGPSRVFENTGPDVYRANCLIHDVVLDQPITVASIGAQSTHRNIAFVDVGTSAACSTDDCRLIGFDTGLIGPLEQLTFVLTPAFATKLRTFVDQQFGATDFVAGDVSRLLFAHLAQSSIAIRAYESQDSEALSKFGDRFCFYDNVEDADNLEQMTGPITMGQEPEFVDLAAWRVDQKATSPCPESGTHEAGITRMNWAMARMGFGPEHTGAIDTMGLVGIAQGGLIRFSLDGVEIQYLTRAGDSAETIMIALADLVQAEATLAALNVGAVALGNEMESNGVFTNLTITDPGLVPLAAPVPSLPPPAAAFAGVLLALLLWRLTRAPVPR